MIDIDTFRRVVETFGLLEHRTFLGEVADELDELRRLAADSRVSPEVIGIRVQNTLR